MMRSCYRMKLFPFFFTQLLLILQSECSCFISLNTNCQQQKSRWISQHVVEVASTTTTTRESDNKNNNNENDLGLTSELEKITKAFQAIGDDKLRYKQLLYMAGQLKPMNQEAMIPENKVIGCMSSVYVDARIVIDDDNRIIEFSGDSDGVLTKGLVALLVRGLSGNTAEQIQKVNPAFIEKAGIQASLTPGRNSGFLNMLSTMKRKALELDAAAVSTIHASAAIAATEAGVPDSLTPSTSGGPMYRAITEILQQLKPTALNLLDVSHRHVGHAERKGVEAEESHFELTVVAEAFEGLNLVKRHQLIYMLLSEIMPKIHALQISALTPEEFSRRKQ